ncbi:hypothetical protein ACJX0J_035352, partial [Zea mays]
VCIGDIFLDHLYIEVINDCAISSPQMLTSTSTPLNRWQQHSVLSLKGRYRAQRSNLREEMNNMNTFAITFQSLVRRVPAGVYIRLLIVRTAVHVRTAATMFRMEMTTIKNYITQA